MVGDAAANLTGAEPDSAATHTGTRARNQTSTESHGTTGNGPEFDRLRIARTNTHSWDVHRHRRQRTRRIHAEGLGIYFVQARQSARSAAVRRPAGTSDWNSRSIN